MPSARSQHCQRGSRTPLQTDRAYPDKGKPCCVDVCYDRELPRVFDVRLCSLSFALCDRLQVWQYAVIARLYPIYFSAVAVVFNFNFFKFFPYHSLVI